MPEFSESMPFFGRRLASAAMLSLARVKRPKSGGVGRHFLFASCRARASILRRQKSKVPKMQEM